MKFLTEEQKATTVPHSSQAAGIHCGAHNLNLTANLAVKAVPYMDKFKDLPPHLYRFYAFSSVRTAGLNAIQKVLDSEQGGAKIRELHATRGLRVATSCAALRNNLAAITVSLSW